MKKLLLCLLLCVAAKAYSQKGYYITSADKMKLWVNEYGTGKPVILLAGGPGLTATYMDSIWLKMPNTRFIVLDERSTGKSVLPKVDSTTITVDNFIEDVEAVRVHLNLPKVTIVGHSWGGMLALLYTEKYPDRVENLILLAGASTGNFFSYFEDNFMMRLTAKEKLDLALPDSDGMVGFKAYWPGYFYSRDRALVTRKNITPASFGKDFSRMDDIIFKEYASYSLISAKKLKFYTGPVSLIQGRQDPTDEATIDETKGYLKQTQVYLIEKCGHFPWLEEPETSKSFFKVLQAVLN